MLPSQRIKHGVLNFYIYIEIQNSLPAFAVAAGLVRHLNGLAEGRRQAPELAF
jgi:hypothetical protein